MTWILRKAIGASAGAIMLVGSLGMPPAIADVPCDTVASAVVDGAETTGDLELSAAWSSDGWTYTATVPSGYALSWLDGTRPVSNVSGFVLGGGELTRSSSITGDFVHISACLVELSHRGGPVLV
jgi:hypothetical protein